MIQIKKKIYQKGIVSLIIFLISATSVFISLLKMLYFDFHANDPLAPFIIDPIRHMIYFIYQKTSFLKYFWIHSPLPNIENPLALENLYFLITYVVMCIAMMIVRSTKKSLFQLFEIERQNRILMGSQIDHYRTGVESLTIQIQKESIFSQFHTLYLAPLLVGLVVALLSKLLGLTK